ncbi:protein of unknown function [Methylocella tundrae]|uniref:Uncharacterized protein n=1 Tax=Methylocella tundrae TaxID=227605 RepID=A0A4U8YXH6_METTU|nr:protein of unknown function [Methylocella tundrae]
MPALYRLRRAYSIVSLARVLSYSFFAGAPCLCGIHIWAGESDGAGAAPLQVNVKR